MFPQSLKSAAAFASSYTRGTTLAKKGSVVAYTVDDFDDGSICEVSGTVLGSGSSPYSTWVKLDLDDQDVVDYECSCPAHANYLGMCKHAIALALTYLNDHPIVAKRAVSSPDSRGVPGAAAQGGSQDPAISDAYAALIDAIEGRKSAAGARSAGQHGAGSPSKSSKKQQSKAKRAKPTSKAITSLMRASAELAQYEAEKALHAADAIPDGGERADFTCTIARISDPYSYRYYGGADDMYELRLRVHRGKASYVVKRIDELVLAWEQGDTVVYGKNLTLAHVPSSFTERAVELLDFVSRLERAQRALYLSRSGYWYAGNGTSSKSLPLTSADAIQVLDIMSGNDIAFEFEGSYTKKTRMVKVASGNPRLSFTLAQVAEGGWDLHVPRDVVYIRCDDDLYVIDDKHAWRCDVDYTRRAGTMIEELFPAGGEPFHIADKDMAVFCERVLPMLEAQADFETPDELAEFVPPEAEFAFRIGMIDGCITCTPTVAYDEVMLPLFCDLAPEQPVRDVARELEAQALVRSYFPNGPVSTPDYAGKRAPVSTAYGALGGPATGYGAREPVGLGMGPGMPWFPEDDVEAFYDLLADGVEAFSALGEVLVSEKLSGIGIRQAPEIHVEASVAGGLLDLSVDAAGLDPGDLVRYLSSYRRKQRYVKLSSGDIMRLGSGVRALSELADGLGVDDEDLLGSDGLGGSLPANRTLFVDALMKEAPGVRFDRDESFRSIVRAFDTVADSDFTEPPELRGVLRSYQRTGFKWLSTLHALGFGGILADDMGLGKTLQVIALFLARKQAAGDAKDAASGAAADTPHGTEAVGLPSLVVCPASLVYNWIAEIERFAPELDAVAIVGPAAERKKTIALAAAGSAQSSMKAASKKGSSEKRSASAEPPVCPDVFITSYDLMKRDIDAYVKADFDIVVLDEAHYIKNAATKSAKAAKRLPGRVRFALTGTPIENRLAELWSIFDFLMPGVLGSHDSFAQRFERPIAANEEGVADRLRSLVAPFILRRLKGDVLTDLPEKNESVVYAVMEGEQDKLYKANVDRLALELSNQMPEEFAANRIAILAELTRLRQICCDPRLAYENFEGTSAKLDTCMELVGSAVEAGHSVLLFSQFTSMLDLIAERMRKAKLGYLMLTGATSKEQRVRLVRDFQAGVAPVFLISLKAGGVGLNLTAADIVIHYDPWWNLAAQNQATDRAHRIGQTRDVSVFKLIAKNTIEERIVAMQEAKRDLAESVLGGDGARSTALTREDILALLDL